jgi:UDPglucose 6-dehydrogenase/GDP-mannose 6-dehydrogenase
VDVAIIGSGYVGIVTGVGLAKMGHIVRCVERDASRVAQINGGESPIYEAGLTEMLADELASGRFIATSDLPSAVRGVDVVLVAVGTPSVDGRIDLRDVLGACEEIGAALRAPHKPVIAMKSTVIPGTTDGPVRETLEASSGLRAGVDFGLAVNPEFLTEGRAIADFVQPDRIVIGADDSHSMTVMRELYAPLQGVPIIAVPTRTAEMIKYASNALLATAISFSNELANFAEAIGGIDMLDVMGGLHASRYLSIGAADRESTTVELASFLLAGCGFGGSCLPKDVSALIAAAHDHGETMPLLSAVLQVNGDRAARVLRMLRQELGPLRDRRVGVLGLAFKADTGDVRESPAIPLIRELVRERAEVTAHDPVVPATALSAAHLDGVAYSADLADLVKNVDAAVLVTSWKEYEDLPRLLAGMNQPPVVIDGRRMISPAAVPRYRGIGLA